MSDVGEVKNALAMRILGGLLIFFSIVEVCFHFELISFFIGCV